MEIVHPRCCGIDVHKESVVACVRIQEPRRARTEVRRFGTTTTELLQLHSWLAETGCTHVALESTSVYWKPVFNVLEGSFEVVLANAYHIKAVPGRKTDVKDCEWLADLLAHGLIRASFIPAARHSCPSRPDASPEEPAPGPRGGSQPGAQAARIREYQAGQRRDGRHGGVRSRDVERLGRGGAGSRDARSLRARLPRAAGEGARRDLARHVY